MNNNKRYLRIGFRFDDLRGMTLNEIGHMFTHEFDESFQLIDVRDDIQYGATYFLVESEKLKEVEEFTIVPTVYTKRSSEETDDGPEYYYELEDYSQHMEPVKTEIEISKEYLPNIVDSRWNYYEEELTRASALGAYKNIYDRVYEHQAQWGTSVVHMLPPNSYYQIYNPITGQMEEYNENSDTYKTHYRGYVGEEKSEQQCEHKWKEYIGFTHRDFYCELCKEKKKQE